MKIKLDLTKIDKSKIVERSYTNREGKNVVVKELSLETVALKAPQPILNKDKQPVEGTTWKLMKTHFVCHEQTKEEKEQRVQSIIVGEGVSFVDRVAQGDEELQQVQRQFMGKKDDSKSESELLAESIPF
jgi:hypothetical protein